MRSLLALSIFMGVSAFAGPKIKFNMTVVYGKNLQPVAAPLVQAAMTYVEAANNGTAEFESREGKPFNLILEVTDTKSADASAPTEEIRKFNSLDGDAYSIFFPDAAADAPVLVRILWDKAMFTVEDGKYRERPDAFTRLVVLLGHEIYGNAVRFKQNEELLRSVQMEFDADARDRFRIDSEINAFDQGEQFVIRAVQTIGASLTPKMQSDFMLALVREREMRQYYQNIKSGKPAKVIGIDAICNVFLNN